MEMPCVEKMPHAPTFSNVCMCACACMCVCVLYNLLTFQGQLTVFIQGSVSKTHFDVSNFILGSQEQKEKVRSKERCALFGVGMCQGNSQAAQVADGWSNSFIVFYSCFLVNWSLSTTFLNG